MMMRFTWDTSLVRTQYLVVLRLKACAAAGARARDRVSAQLSSASRYMLAVLHEHGDALMHS